MKKLAIVIPAYKKTFLKDAITSIISEAGDTANIYIFDDCSPDNLHEVVEEFLCNENVKYYRFENNMGRLDLAGHWNRCIDRTQDEPWIWLFSDDDRVLPGTLTAIVNVIDNASEKDVLCMDIEFIDELNCPTGEYNKPPSLETAKDYAINRLKGQRKVCAADHVFSRFAYLASGKILSFPIAWYSDEVTWHNMVTVCQGCLRRIDNAVLQFRLSGINISTIHAYDQEKQLAQIMAYHYWLRNFHPTGCSELKALSTWRRMGLLAAGVNPISLKAWRHLGEMNLTPRQKIYDLTISSIIKAKILLNAILFRLRSF